MKRISILLVALVIFLLPLQQNYLEAEAAVISKAATLTAKKMAKEVIQDAAVNQAANMAVLEAIDIANKYQSKPGFKVVCPTGGTVCDKPVQIKEQLSASDKTNIKAQSGVELDKLIAPGGKGFTKWQKLLDWFLPVWLGAIVVTAITYAISPDVKSLFDEAAYNALVALGIISPVETTINNPINEIETPLTEDDTQSSIEDGIQTNYVTNNSATATPIYKGISVGVNDRVMVEHKITVSDSTFITGNMYLGLQHSNSTYIILTEMFNHSNLGARKDIFGSSTPKFAVAVNGQTVGTTGNNGSVSSSSTANYIYTPPSPELIQPYIKKATILKIRMPYEISGLYYTDVLYGTDSGDTVTYQITTTEMPNFPDTITGLHSFHAVSPGKVTSMQQTVYSNLEPYKKILVPSFEETAEIGMSSMDNSSYQDESGNVAFIPPVAIPYQQETTGESVRQVPNANGDGWTFQKPDGTIVPEDEVIPNPQWEPNVTPGPEGVPQITPQPNPKPDPSNPVPEAIPLTPGETTTPNPGTETPTNPPINGEEPPMEPFPDGESCQEKLKFPIFSPLKEQFSTSFPFSIPWDMERAINAAFAEIGNDKPSFTLDLAFMGDTKEIVITVPKMFDDWKPFTDTLLLLTFDILIMFGVYRFVKGAGS